MLTRGHYCTDIRDTWLPRPGLRTALDSRPQKQRVFLEVGNTVWLFRQFIQLSAKSGTNNSKGWD